MKNEKAHPLISIVMPVYNEEKYIKESIDSILNQTFENFEFIIIDDASTDNSWDIIKSYDDKRILAIQNKINLGNYPSRNEGARMAKGKYIAVMDSDDIACAERLEKQYKYLEKHPHLVALGSEFTFSDGKKITKSPLSYEGICISLIKNFKLLHPSLMIRNSFFHSIGGYDEKYKYASDYDLFCRICLNGEIEILEDTLMIYRRHPNQISNCYSIEQGVFANKIRERYQVSFINHFKKKEQSKISLQEVGVLEIGLIICLYTYGRYLNSYKYEKLADKMIDTIYNGERNILLDEEIGLIELANGLLYLLRNGFLEGDENEVLEEIDCQIIKQIRKGAYKKRKILFYMNKRFKNANLKKDGKRFQIYDVINK